MSSTVSGCSVSSNEGCLVLIKVLSCYHHLVIIANNLQETQDGVCTFRSFSTVAVLGATSERFTQHAHAFPLLSTGLVQIQPCTS